jgi:integrase
MAIDKPTAFLFHDKRRMKKNGKFPIKLIVDFSGERKSFNLPEEFSADDWDKINSGKKIQREELKELKARVFYYTGEKFEKAIREIELSEKPFTFPLFEQVYFGVIKNNQTDNSVYSAFDRKIESLISAGRPGSANCCKGAKNSLQTFAKKLNFKDVTPDFLLGYEKYLLKEKKSSVTTVGIHLRELRAIINEAMNNPDNPVRMEYPFSRNKYDKKYQIPQAENKKKALPFDDIDKIKSYEANTDSERRAVDFWLFSYYCNGINMADIAYLTFNNLENDFIVFRRKKTSNTKKNAKEIRAHIRPEMQSIINRWGNQPVLKSDFIFPILQNNLTPEREHQLIKQFTRWVNGYLWSVSEKLSLSQKISTYHARHSYATTLKRRGVSIAHISESLGHSDLKTTENYLDSFTTDTIKEISGLL